LLAVVPRDGRDAGGAALADSFHTGLSSKNTSVCSLMPNAVGCATSTRAESTDPGM
jgi:hypothetical protein